MDRVPATNMTVVTNLRSYAFELSVRPKAVRDDKSILYTLRFQYPEVATAIVEPPEAAPLPPPPPPPPEVANDAYSYDGSVKSVPTRIFDDRHATYFQFREGEAYPAIFSVDADGGEVVVNSSMHGTYVVVDQVARAFVLRQGSEVTRIYNDGFHEALPGPQSPRPRPKRCWMFCR
jgi:type IV secretion system protein VirB9